MIISYPDPRLTHPVSKAVVDSETAEKHSHMMKYWLRTRADGVALAANQIGLDADMFIYYDKENILRTVLNPVITMYSEKLLLLDEGCLSLPNVTVVNKPRSEHIEVTYIDYPSMKKFYAWKQGFEARIFQHEIDHLSGKVIIK